LIDISENRFRNPATPLDDAHNIKRLLNIYQMTDEQIAGVYFPTAKTEGEIKAARKFVKDRIALISLSDEAAEAVKSGRVKESAAVAIAKLSQAQQHEVLKKEGTIERSDVKRPNAAPKVPKALSRDPELMRRVTATLEDVAGILLDDDCPEYVEIDRQLLRDLYNYVEEIKPKAAAAA
jgi:hypothetical protein